MNRQLITLLWGALLMIGSGLELRAQVNEQDSLALVALYNATDGPGWVDKEHWLTGPVSQWRGVAVTGNRVTILNLNVNQLKGSIPSELGDLANLTDLRLEHNQLTGPIPPELGNLTNLEDLRLVSNQLTGAIPPELGNLVKLKNFRLNHNLLTGSIPPELGNLVNLTLMRLVSNQITGSIPPELGNLINLTGLNLGSNQITGSIPSELGNLFNLTDLLLNHNQLSGAIPPQLSKLTNLTDLSLASNQLTGVVPQDFGSLTNLEFLSLSGNPLSGILPLSLTNLSLLSSFSFDDTNLCEPIDDDFQAWIQGVTDVSSTGCTKSITEEPLPKEVVLDQNYPNPFNSETLINYTLPQLTDVRLVVYNLQGQRVAVLVEAEQPAGQYEARFEPGVLPSGVYIYRLETGDSRVERRMLLLR